MKLPEFNEVMKNGARVLASAPDKKYPEKYGIVLAIYGGQLITWRVWDNLEHEVTEENEWICWQGVYFDSDKLGEAWSDFRDRAGIELVQS